jgi:hypothetical protein
MCETFEYSVIRRKEFTSRLMQRFFSAAVFAGPSLYLDTTGYGEPEAL